MYRSYIPGPPLADFVSLFWLYEGYELPHAKECVLPDGSIRRILSTTSGPFPASIPGPILCSGASISTTFHSLVEVNFLQDESLRLQA